MESQVTIPVLYHFTSNRFVDSIMKEGLTKGCILSDFRRDPLGVPKVKFAKGWQWMTTNESFDQEWAVGTGRLPYKRNDVRMKIVVPPGVHRLNPWSQIKFLFPKTAHLLSEFGDPQNWWVYEGIVKPEWIKELKRKPQ